MRFPHRIKGKTVAKFLLVHLVFFLGVLFYSFAFGCLLRRLTGITCPGCGLSRAYLACLRLDFGAAFAFHPLFPLLPPYLLYMLEHHIFGFPGNKKLTIALTVAITILLIGVWILRVALNDPVVAFHPEEGLIDKIVTFFTNS